MASASTHRKVAVLVVLLVAMAGTASLVRADCPSDISGLQTCSNAVVPGGSYPDATCCGTINSWGLDCLCNLVTEYGNSFKGSIDINECLALPKECGVPVPAGYVCDGYPVPSS